MAEILKPAFLNNNIPLIFSTDKNFVPYLDVCLKSLIANSSEQNNYDIVIMYSDISEYLQKRILQNRKSNVSIRFLCMDEYMDRYKEHWYTHWGWSDAVYYRFFIPEIFGEYKKVVFLDADTVINFDVKELYDIDTEGNPIAAAVDLPRLLKEDAYIDYITNVLKTDRNKYFNAGIFVMDLEKISIDDFTEKCLQILKELKEPVFQDQDVFNVLFFGKVKFLEMTYNLSWNIFHCHKNSKERMDEELYARYLATWETPKIVHYAGGCKPWKQPWLAYSDYFWRYARMSSFYEEIIYKNQPKGIDRDVIRNAVRKRRIYVQYLKCKLLKSVTFGKLREHYIEKANKMKVKVNDYRKTLGI